MSSSCRAPLDEEAICNETKKARTRSPDIIVAVGSGESRREFECYKAILYFASEYFQTMVTSNMEEDACRIDFPDKNPDDWELFYEFISVFRFDAKKMINDDNAIKLLPWFHEFRMDEGLKECDIRLAKIWRKWRCNRYSFGTHPDSWKKKRLGREPEDEHQTRLAERKIVFDEAMSMLKMASLHNLKHTRDAVGGGMSELMDMLLDTYDLFDLQVIRALLQTVLPLGLAEEGEKITCGGCKSLCQAFEKLLSPHFLLLRDIVDKGNALDCALPALVYSFRQIELEKAKALFSLEDAEHRLKRYQDDAQTSERELKKSAKHIISTLLRHPDIIHQSLPDGRSMKNCGKPGESIASYGRRCSRVILSSQCKSLRSDFKHLGIKPLSEFQAHVNENKQN